MLGMACSRALGAHMTMLGVGVGALVQEGAGLVKSLCANRSIAMS